MLHYVADDNEISGFWLETRNKEISVFSSENLSPRCNTDTALCYSSLCVGGLSVNVCSVYPKRTGRIQFVPIMKLEWEEFRHNAKSHYHQDGVRFPAPGWNDDLPIQRSWKCYLSNIDCIYFYAQKRFDEYGFFLLGLNCFPNVLYIYF